MSEPHAPHVERLSPASWGLLALLAAMPVVMASGFPAYEAVKTTALLGGGALLWLLWAAHALRGQALALRGGLALLPLLGLGVLAAASALWAPNAWKALVGAARWWALGAVVFTALAPAGRPVRASDAAAAVGLARRWPRSSGWGSASGWCLTRWPLAPAPTGCAPPSTTRATPR